MSLGPTSCNRIEWLADFVLSIQADSSQIEVVTSLVLPWWNSWMQVIPPSVPCTDILETSSSQQQASTILAAVARMRLKQ